MSKQHREITIVVVLLGTLVFLHFFLVIATYYFQAVEIEAIMIGTSSGDV